MECSSTIDNKLRVEVRDTRTEFTVNLRHPSPMTRYVLIRFDTIPVLSSEMNELHNRVVNTIRIQQSVCHSKINKSHNGFDSERRQFRVLFTQQRCRFERITIARHSLVRVSQEFMHESLFEIVSHIQSSLCPLVNTMHAIFTHLSRVTR